MKWLKDLTGRFPERPYYDAEELDGLGEGVIINFLREKYGGVSFPVSTEDLTVLIESETSDLDQYADLTSEGDDVEGVTFFFSDRKPIVKIAEELAATYYREHRLRTTLTHELAHVKLHGGLWQFNQLRLLPSPKGGGLIEAAMIGFGISVVSLFPSPKGGGLIEARSGLSSQQQSRTFPSPKGGGLIEASER